MSRRRFHLATSISCPVDGVHLYALIRAGTLKFFQAVGLRYTELPWRHSSIGGAKIRWWLSGDTSDSVLIVGGGGAWCDLYSRFDDVKAMQRRFRSTIVLPSTYQGSYSLLATTFFCRDTRESLAYMPEVSFCHDMAFYLGPQAHPNGRGVGSFFRTGPERLGNLTIPPDNRDISREGNERHDVAPFFAAIARHAVVHTNRLHVGIAACLLGRELHFYPGSYFKNKAAYVSSIKGRYPGAHFHSFEELKARVPTGQ